MRVRLKVDIAGPAGVFRSGEVVSDAQMPRDQLKHLVARGYAELVGERQVEQAVMSVPETADIKHIGSGWYELPDGSKVRGKKAAGLA